VVRRHLGRRLRPDTAFVASTIARHWERLALVEPDEDREPALAHRFGVLGTPTFEPLDAQGVEVRRVRTESEAARREQRLLGAARRSVENRKAGPRPAAWCRGSEEGSRMPRWAPRRWPRRGGSLLTPDEWEEVRPLLERGFGLEACARLLGLRRAVARGERHEGQAMDRATQRRLAFARWLVRTGRLHG
jgi:hypothetical protein